MDFGYTPEQEALRREVRAFIAEHVTPEVNAIAAMVMVATLVVIALLVAATNIRSVAGARDQPRAQPQFDEQLGQARHQARNAQVVHRGRQRGSAAAGGSPSSAR